MLIIWSCLYKKDVPAGHVTVKSDRPDTDGALLECLQQICRHFDLELPMWHTKHTKELASSRKATFKKDDFLDQFNYDRLVIEMLEK